MRGSRLVVAAGSALLLTLTACGGSSDPTSSGSGSAKGGLADGGRYVMALPSDPGNLDPSTTPSDVARQMLGLAYDTLVYQKENGAFVSGLASSWSSTPTTAKFTLRPGVTCSDGSPLKATDVADNLTYIANPKNASPLLNVLVHEGVTVAADDTARTVTVTSPSANGFLLSELAGVYIICRAGLDNHKSLTNKIVGTGPWVLKDSVSGDHYDFAPRKDYNWGPDGTKLEGKGVPDSVRVRIITNATTTANLVLRGEVNYAAVSGPDATRLDALRLPTIDQVSTAGETWFNHTAGNPAADKSVREALTLAVDRTAVGKIATGGTAQPSKGFITLKPNPCSGGDTVSGNLPDYDLAKAKQVLDAAGWTVGSDGIRVKGGKKLSIDFRYDAQGKAARTTGAEYLAAAWKKLGVDVDIKALPEAQLNELFFSTGAWDVAWAPFTFSLPSQMVAFVSGAVTPNGANFPHIDNAAYSRAATAATPQVGRAGCGDWAAAEKALLSDFDVVPLFDSVNRTYIRKASVTAPGGQVWGATIRLRTA